MPSSFGKAKELVYQRKFNLGNYESEQISLAVELEEGTNLEEAFRELRETVFALKGLPRNARLRGTK